MTISSYDKFDKAFAEGDIKEVLKARSLVGQGVDNANLPIFYRYVVLETVFDPQSVDETKLEYWEHELDVSNMKYATSLPRNAIIAKRIRSGNSGPNEPTLLLYPFFPPSLSFPCKPGEHVWVMFEDRSTLNSDMGYWFCRIVQPGYVEDINHTHAPRRDDPSFEPGIQEVFEGKDEAVYEFRNGITTVSDGERYTDAESAPIAGTEDVYKDLMLNSDAGRLTTYESVPRYRKRPADIVLEGNNNAMIVLGRDRSGQVADYGPDSEFDPEGTRGLLPTIPSGDTQTSGAGSIDLVVGRGQTGATGGNPVANDLPGEELGKATQELSLNEGDPDFVTDRSRILISQKTSVDTNFNLQEFNLEHDSGEFQGNSQQFSSVSDNFEESPEGDGAIVIKTDKVRIIARSDIEFLVMGHTRADDGTMITDDDQSNWAAVVIKANGDIVIRPAEKGFIKLGSDSANKAIVCTDFPAVAKDGKVTAPPINTTMAGQLGGTGIATQGAYASKILVDGPDQ